MDCHTAMKGAMRSIGTDKEHEALSRQNDQMAMEIVKLREMVHLLKKKNRSLTVRSLKLAETAKDATTQTDNIEPVEKRVDNPVEKVLARFPTSDKTEYNPLLRERLNHSNSLKFSHDEFVEHEESLPTPGMSKFSPRQHGKSPKLALSPRMLGSPTMKKKMFYGISDRIVRALYPTAGRSPLKNETTVPASFSPQAKMASKESRVSEAFHDVEVTTADAPVFMDRTPRRVKKPTSYKEHSLKVKVRRSFKFIKFEESAEAVKEELPDVPEEQKEL